MKWLRILLFSMAICFASGMKAQFYDSADDIYYYVESYTEVEEKTQVYWNGMPTARWEKTGKLRKENANEGSESVMIFNFDGMKAAELTGYLGGAKIYDVKKRMQENPSYYEDKVETTDYKWKYSSSSLGTTYKNGSYLLIFSSDRNTLIEDHNPAYAWKKYFKRVDKNYFKVGRSRTPSSTMHE